MKPVAGFVGLYTYGASLYYLKHFGLGRIMESDIIQCHCGLFLIEMGHKLFYCLIIMCILVLKFPVQFANAVNSLVFVLAAVLLTI